MDKTTRREIEAEKRKTDPFLFGVLILCGIIIIAGTTLLVLSSFGIVKYFRGNEVENTATTDSSDYAPKTATDSIDQSSVIATDDSLDYQALVNCTQVKVDDFSPVEISTLSPGVKQRIETNYYSIYGWNKNELSDQLSDCGPDGYSGYTGYWINWQYQFDRKDSGKCNVKNIAVGLSVAFFYPQWKMPKNPEPDSGLLPRWQTFIAALETHENGHKLYAVGGANSVYNSLSSLPDANTCKDAENLANSTAQHEVDVTISQNEEYDRSTNHGETQGAVFY